MADLLSFAAKEKNKQIKYNDHIQDRQAPHTDKKTISKSDLHPLKGVGNEKIDVFKVLTIRGPFELAAKEKNKQIK